MKERLIVALDTSTGEKALELVKALKEHVGMFKVGMELFYAEGPDIVRKIVDTGTPVFLDLKLHDIPNTVSGALKQIVRLGASMINVHAGGGGKMLVKARESILEEAEMLGITPPRLIAVTVLTSLGNEELQEELGVKRQIEAHVVELAKLSRDARLDGVVASPQEIRAIKEECGDGFLTVTPGIRPQWAQKQDQSRVMTPAEAVLTGGDYFVIGRLITAADNPADAAEKILEEMRGSKHA